MCIKEYCGHQIWGLAGTRKPHYPGLLSDTKAETQRGEATCPQPPSRAASWLLKSDICPFPSGILHFLFIPLSPLKHSASQSTNDLPSAVKFLRFLPSSSLRPPKCLGPTKQLPGPCQGGRQAERSASGIIFINLYQKQLLQSSCSLLVLPCPDCDCCSICFYCLGNQMVLITPTVSRSPVPDYMLAAHKAQGAICIPLPLVAGRGLLAAEELGPRNIPRSIPRPVIRYELKGAGRAE